jgi:hypothetical protein
MGLFISGTTPLLERSAALKWFEVEIQAHGPWQVPSAWWHWFPSIAALARTSYSSQLAPRTQIWAATLRQFNRSPRRRSQSELHREPERLGRLEVDHQLEFDRKLDASLARLRRSIADKPGTERDALRGLAERPGRRCKLGRDDKLARQCSHNPPRTLRARPCRAPFRFLGTRAHA